MEFRSNRAPLKKSWLLRQRDLMLGQGRISNDADDATASGTN